MPQNSQQRSDASFDLEAEQAVLGAFFVDDDTWQRLGETFSPEAFYLVAHQSIAAAIIARCKRGEPGDPVLIRGDLADAGDRVAADLVFPLAKGLGTAANVSYYWQRLLRLHERRAEGIPDELAALSIGGALAKEETALEHGTKHVATGWSRLDRALGGGFGVPSLNIIGAAPKSGKSTWAQIIAERHVEAGGFVYYLDLENGRRRFMRRMLCRHAKLGGAQVAAALRPQRSGAFQSLEEVERWQRAKLWVQEKLTPGFLAEFTPPKNFAARVAAARQKAGDRPLLVVLDSLQKLPMDLEDRRAGVDAWIRLLERLRHEHEAAVLLISEIKRDQKGQYTAHEAAFKESGGIEYAADLAMTLTRPTADESAQACSTLRVELARDCDDDPRGEVASYRPLFPFYGLEEIEPERWQPKTRNGASSRRQKALPTLAAAGTFDADP
jgi:replicative DNA helicase